eukprot:Nk52_evm7s1485 gene=Nk52_evmTU7s1485
MAPGSTSRNTRNKKGKDKRTVANSPNNAPTASSISSRTPTKVPRQPADNRPVPSPRPTPSPRPSFSPHVSLYYNEGSDTAVQQPLRSASPSSMTAEASSSPTTVSRDPARPEPRSKIAANTEYISRSGFNEFVTNFQHECLTSVRNEFNRELDIRVASVRDNLFSEMHQQMSEFTQRIMGLVDKPISKSGENELRTITTWFYNKGINIDDGFHHGQDAYDCIHYCGIHMEGYLWPVLADSYMRNVLPEFSKHAPSGSKGTPSMQYYSPAQASKLVREFRDWFSRNFSELTTAEDNLQAHQNIAQPADMTLNEYIRYFRSFWHRCSQRCPQSLLMARANHDKKLGLNNMFEVAQRRSHAQEAGKPEATNPVLKERRVARKHNATRVEGDFKAAQSDVVESHFKELVEVFLSPAVFRHRRTNNICLKCGKDGHRVENCPSSVWIQTQDGVNKS